MKIKENLTVNGILKIMVFNKHGAIISCNEGSNLVVDGGRDAIVKLLGEGGDSKKLTKIGFGDNGLDPVPGDNSLNNVFSKVIGNITYPASNKMQIDWTLELNENNGMEIKEYGLICNDGTLFSRKSAPIITKTDQIRLQGSWVLTI